MTESDAPPPLQPLDIEVGSVLAIVAHPDDLEYGAAAAVAAWTAAGQSVAYLLVTKGEAGIDGMPPDEAARIREEEQRASAAVVGVDQVEFLDHADGVIEYGLQLRHDLAAEIRRRRPDTLLLFNHREGWGMPGSFNSPDHRNVGWAALEAAGDAGNRWVFRDLVDQQGLMPHKVKAALVAGSPQSTHGLDVTATTDKAVESLRAHRAYLEGLGDHAMSDPEFVRMFLEQAGLRLGVGAAVGFEVFRF